MTASTDSSILSDREREIYGPRADVLIPDSEGMPSATQADVHTVWIDTALAARPDLVNDFRASLALGDEDDPEAAIEALHAEGSLFDAFSVLTAGAYFMNPQIKRRIGYPGQEARPVTGDDVPTYIDMLEKVVDRGPIYTPTTIQRSSSSLRRKDHDMSKFTLELAQRIVEASLAKATEIGAPSSIAILDVGRELLAFVRQDGALLASCELSQNKAYTAISMQMKTGDLQPLVQPGGPLFGLPNGQSRPFIAFGGGAPIVIGDSIVGAIGVAGGSAEQDEEVAAAGAAVAAQLTV